MESIPDELLLMILSHIPDGAFLLDTASLVCKRWRALCREPAAWASVDLHLTFLEDLREQARVLLHAPALRSLTIDDLDVLTVKALQRSRAAVRHSVSLRAGGHYCLRTEVVARAFMDLLSRSRGLRHLSWELLKLKRHFMETDSAGRPAAAVLASMSRLRSLSLRHKGCHDLAYAAELAAGVPSLEELSICATWGKYLMPCCDPRLQPFVDQIHTVHGPAASAVLDSIFGPHAPPGHFVAAQAAAAANPVPHQAAAADVNPAPHQAAAAAGNQVSDEVVAAGHAVPHQAAAAAVHLAPDEAAPAGHYVPDPAVAAGHQVVGQAVAAGHPGQATAAGSHQVPGHALGYLDFLLLVPHHVTKMLPPEMWPMQNIDCLARDLVSGPGSRLRSLHLEVDLSMDAASGLLDALARCPALETLALGRLTVGLGASRRVHVARLKRFLLAELPATLEFLRLSLVFRYCCHMMEGSEMDPEDRLASEAAVVALGNTRRALRQCRPGLVVRLVNLEGPDMHGRDIL